MLIVITVSCAGLSAGNSHHQPNASVDRQSAAEQAPEVFIPDGPGPYPVAVTIHGGGWVGGDPIQMRPLALELAERGFVAVNITYQTMDSGGRFPGMVEDVACGVIEARDLARAHADKPDGVYVVAHSAGAHLAALAAFAPDEFPCPDGGSIGIDGFVGLAGPYDVTRLTILNTLFGATLEEDPGLWERGNPRTYASSAPHIPILLIHGDADEVVPVSFSSDLAGELEVAGHDVELLQLPGATHGDVRDPDVVAEVIVQFVGTTG